MKYTKRSRRENLERVLRWYIKECKINDLDVAVGMPELWDMLDDEGEFDFDDVVRALDFIGVDLVAVPRGETRKMSWFTINEMPYDDGGKNRERTAIELKRSRVGKAGKGRKKERKQV